MSKNGRIMLSGALVLIALALYIIGIIILPETIGLQIQMDGSMGNNASKYVGLLIPFALTAGGAIYYYMKEEGKSLFVSFVGIAVFGFTFIMIR